MVCEVGIGGLRWLSDPTVQGPPYTYLFFPEFLNFNVHIRTLEASCKGGCELFSMRMWCIKCGREGRGVVAGCIVVLIWASSSTLGASHEVM